MPDRHPQGPLLSTLALQDNELDGAESACVAFLAWHSYFCDLFEMRTDMPHIVRNGPHLERWYHLQNSLPRGVARGSDLLHMCRMIGGMLALAEKQLSRLVFNVYECDYPFVCLKGELRHAGTSDQFELWLDVIDQHFRPLKFNEALRNGIKLNRGPVLLTAQPNFCNQAVGSSQFREPKHIGRVAQLSGWDFRVVE